MHLIQQQQEMIRLAADLPGDRVIAEIARLEKSVVALEAIIDEVEG